MTDSTVLPPPSSPLLSADGVAVARRVLASVAVLALLGMVLALLLLNRTASTYRDGLEVTRDGASVAALSLASADDLASDLSALADTTADTLDQFSDLVVLASTTADSTGVALGTNLASAIDGTASIADGVAGLIESIERFIPGDSDSLAEDLRTIADGMEPIPQQMRELGDMLAMVSTEMSNSVTSINTAAAQLSLLSTSITAAAKTLVEAEAVTSDVAARAERALDRSSTDLWLLRALVVVLGLGVIGVCFSAYRSIGLLAATSEPWAPPVQPHQ